MMLRYYSQEKQAKIELHKTMAGQMGITINTLRLRVLRLKDGASLLAHGARRHGLASTVRFHLSHARLVR